VSLILDALKKLERDKDAREPNVLVVGSVPWGTRARSRLPLVVALGGAALVALVAFALWPRERTARPPAAPPSPAVSSPAAPPTPSGSGVAPGTTPATGAAVAPPEPRRPSVPSAESAAVDDQPAEATGALEEQPATAPPRRGTSVTDELRLNAISRRDGRPVALINDRLVFEGDGFDGVKVLRIGETEVEVEVRGQKRVLRF
jgi:hypothetical protein